jgi:hypothetical protein
VEKIPIPLRTAAPSPSPHSIFPHPTSPTPSSISSLSSPSWTHDLTILFHTPQDSTTCTSWPLSDPIESALFSFYLTTASSYWDLTSSHSIFSHIVPSLALTSPMLLDAVLMFASQHIPRVDPEFPTTPYVYHERVVQRLIPSLGKGTAEASTYHHPSTQYTLLYGPVTHPRARPTALPTYPGGLDDATLITAMFLRGFEELHGS